MRIVTCALAVGYDLHSQHDFPKSWLVHNYGAMLIMSNFAYDSFSPLHPVRKLRSDLEDLERALNLVECSYSLRIQALEREMNSDLEAIRRRIRQMQATDYWSWQKEA